MPRLTADDITDELVKPVVTAADLEAVDAYLDDLARSLTAGADGYDCDGAEYTIADIPTPLPYKVKNLAIAFLCREVCAKKSGGQAAAFRGQESGDKWTAKLPYFARMVENMEGQITPAVLVGKRTSAAVGAIRLVRA